MPDAIGTAYVEIRPDVSKFQSTVDRELRSGSASALTIPVHVDQQAISREAEKAASTAGQAFGGKWNASVRESTSLSGEAKEGLEGLRGGIEKIGSAASGVLGMFGGLGPMAAMAGGAGGLEFIAKGVEAAGDYEAALTQLNQALLDNHQTMTGPMQVALEETESRMRSLGFTDTEVTQALTKATMAGVPWKAALEGLGTAADLARAKSIPLADAQQALIYGAQGFGRSLRDLGVTLPPTIANANSLKTAEDAVATAQDKVNAAQDKAANTVGPAHKKALQELAAANDELKKKQADVDSIQRAQNDHMAHYGQILDIVNPKVKGQAAAAADTYQGAMQRLNAEFDRIEVSLGQAVIPLLERFAAWVDTHQQDIEGAFKGIGNLIATVAGDIGTLVGWLGDVDSAIKSISSHIPTLGIGSGGPSTHSQGGGILDILEQGIGIIPFPKQHGGPLEPGVPYLFGERGPEVGVFSQPGWMFSNDHPVTQSALGTGGGPVTHNYNVVVSQANPQPWEIAREISWRQKVAS
jgi:hypothetical protein